MSSEVEICNRALIEIGAKTIISLNDNIKTARLCKILYGPERDALLRSHTWKFATKRQALGLLSSSELGYTYAYQLPSDYIRLIFPDYTVWAYQIEQNMLLTNTALSYVKYIFRVTEVQKMDPSFQTALAIRIAIKLAKPIADDVNLKKDLRADFTLAMSTARNTGAVEMGPQWVDSEEWLLSRHAGVAGPTGLLRDSRVI